MPNNSILPQSARIYADVMIADSFMQTIKDYRIPSSEIKSYANAISAFNLDQTIIYLISLQNKAKP
jgi:hypothetical protein